MRWPWRRLWPRTRRRLTTGLALVAYLVVSVGVPLPARTVKDHGLPFPCQDHPCGCRSAEECWSHCCCFTHEEHLAWAREHQVEPPAYFYQAEEHEPPACCVHHHEGAHDCCKSPAKPAVPPSGMRWATLVNALGCRGLTPFGTLAAPAISPPAAVSWTGAAVCVGWLALDECTPLRVSSLPLEPPPRA